MQGVKLVPGSGGKWRNNMHYKWVHSASRQPHALYAPQRVEMGGNGFPSQKEMTKLIVSGVGK